MRRVEVLSSLESQAANFPGACQWTRERVLDHNFMLIFMFILCSHSLAWHAVDDRDDW